MLNTRCILDDGLGFLRLLRLPLLLFSLLLLSLAPDQTATGTVSFLPAQLPVKAETLLPLWARRASKMRCFDGRKGARIAQTPIPSPSKFATSHRACRGMLVDRQVCVCEGLCRAGGSFGAFVSLVRPADQGHEGLKLLPVAVPAVQYGTEDALHGTEHTEPDGKLHRESHHSIAPHLTALGCL